ncbi:MAG: hypothetical protein ACT4OM_12570 [Actinomycetota bacterium]
MSKDPAAMLGEIDRLSRRTNNLLNPIAMPSILFGTLMVISAGIGAFAGGQALGWFWMVAGPLGGTATAWYYHRREDRLGFQTNPLPWVATAVLVMVGCVAAGLGGEFLSNQALSALGPLLVISAGYSVFGRLGRSRPVQGSAVALGLAVLAMWALGVTSVSAASAVTAVYGFVILMIGAASRRSEENVA